MVPNDDVCRVLVPSGVLGSGCPDEAMRRGIALKPHAIAVDGGSTDSGPYYLGTGASKMTRSATKRDLRQLMSARDQLGVPLLVGSCGTCGVDAGVEWMADIAREIAAEEGFTARLALVYSEQSASALGASVDAGRVEPLPPAGPLTRERLAECDHIVGLLGYEPLAAALTSGADIVLAGRATDTAVLAAVPLLRGLPAGPTWHAAKTAECGGLCTVNPRQGGVLMTIRSDAFDIEPLHPANRCTPATVAAHLLYENADPWRLKEPGVVLDTRSARYEALDDRTVRVTGSWADRTAHTMKLEGAGGAGYRTMAFVGIADPKVLARLGEWLDRLEDYLRRSVQETLGFGPDGYALELRPYGWNALDPRPRRPTPTPPLEAGVMLLVTAPFQAAATEIAKLCNPALLHFPLEPEAPLPSFAFPFSPAEVELGRQYEFKLNHVVALDDPLQLSRTRFETLGGRSDDDAG